MSEANALDNVISFFNPAAGAKRARARLALEQARRYEGAAGGRRNENWQTPSTSADAALGPSLERLRNPGFRMTQPVHFKSSGHRYQIAVTGILQVTGMSRGL